MNRKRSEKKFHVRPGWYTVHLVFKPGLVYDYFIKEHIKTNNAKGICQWIKF
jgi:hypothetical protein